MKYIREIRRSLTMCPSYVLEDIKNDLMRIDTSKRFWKERFVMNMWLLGGGDWDFFSGSKIVNIDKGEITKEKVWRDRMKYTYEKVTEKTNRYLFGRRYFRKTPYPTSIVVFDKSREEGNGKHIHCLHQFPGCISNRKDEYTSTFIEFFNQDDWNKNVGRTFYFEVPTSQEDVTRYVTGKIKNDYEDGWFTVG